MIEFIKLTDARTGEKIVVRIDLVRSFTLLRIEEGKQGIKFENIAGTCVTLTNGQEFLVKESAEQIFDAIWK